MRVLQVLAEVVCTKELLRLVTLAELVHVVQMIGTHVPLWWIGELLTAIPARVHCAIRHRRMERSLGTCESCT